MHEMGIALEIIDIVEVGVVKFVDLRVDIARHGDVDQKHRPVFTALQDVFHLALTEYKVRRAGGCA